MFALVVIPGYGKAGKVSAAGPQYSGEKYDFQKWEFNTSTGELRLSASADTNYLDIVNGKYRYAHVTGNQSSQKAADYPWHSYRNQIKSIWVSKDIYGIGSEAFLDCENLTKVTFESDSELNFLNKYCFKGCTSLKSITLPNSIRYIKDSVFEGTGLESFTMPSKAVGIYEGCFRNCKNLKSFSFKNYEPDNTDSWIGKKVFEGCISLETITIPAFIRMIQDNAFSGCTALKDVTFADSASFESAYISIGYYAFAGCTSLKNIVLPAHTEDIMDSAFQNCTKLESVSIKESDRSLIIRDKAFADCPLLKTVYLPKRTRKFLAGSFDINNKNLALYLVAPSNAVNDAKEYGLNYEFTNGGTCGANLKWYIDSAAKELVITGTGKMDDYDEGMSPWTPWAQSAEKITIEAGATSIGNNAFYNLQKVKDVVIADTVKTIGSNAFASEKALENVTLSKKTESIGDEAFSGCTSLAKVEVPDSTTSIGKKAFEGCTSLGEITIPKSVTQIGDDAFKGASDKMKIKTEDGSVAADYAEKVGIKSTGKSTAVLKAEEENKQKDKKKETGKNPKKTPDKNETKVAPKKGKTFTVSGFTYKITKAASDDGKTAGTVTLTKVSKKNLAKANIAATVKKDGFTYKITAIGANAFKGQKKLATVTIGANVANIGKGAFNGCASLKTITIKSGKLTKVGANAFKGINKKATIKVPKAKKKAYTKLLSGKGQAKTVKIK
ncbi:MAG: leucine-rich repeat protein [Eubacterium sp.]|nr:leucine-rich repeat protein [Eubacterium sp.]